MDEQVRTYTQVTQRPRVRRRRWWPWAVAAVGVAVLLYEHPWSGGAGSGAQSGKFNPADLPQSVKATAATTGKMPIVIDGLGTVTPLANVTIRTQINGQLMEVGFREGQIVHKGDFLAQIDPRPYQAMLAQAQGTLAKDQALLATSRLDLNRYQTLNRQDSIARQQVDTQASLVRQYEGQVITDQAAVDTQKLNLIYCHIEAPVGGRVGLRQVDPGNYAQTSDTNGLVVLTQLEPISVIFTVPEDALSQILPRLRQGTTLPVTAYDRGNATKIADGTLDTVDNQIDTTTGTVKIRSVFDNKDDALFPNQFVNARLLVDTLQNVVLIPNAGVQHGAPGDFVWVVSDDHTVKSQTVKLGPTDGTNTAILDGLTAGTLVVTDGTDRLKADAKIILPEDQGGANGADAANGSGSRHRHRSGGGSGQGGGPP